MDDHRSKLRALLAAMGRPCVVDETEAEFATLRAEDGLARSLAASALVMAHELDNPKPSLAMKAMAARELRDTMDRIRELAPPSRRKDFVDDIKDEVADARAKRAKAKTTVKSAKPGARRPAAKARKRP
ncbi:MAG: hypothetical protein ACREFZ_09830 [Acetobacteraceae bacterium]